jgi:hypothetical protein
MDFARSDPIYLTQYGGALDPYEVGHIFRDSGKRAGVNLHVGPKPGEFKGARIRYGWHSHEARDTIRTLARGRADIVVAEFILGHEIDKLGYDKSPWENPAYYRQEYSKISRPWLNPISGVALKVEQELSAKFEQRLASLEQQIQDRLGMKAPS